MKSLSYILAIVILSSFSLIVKQPRIAGKWEVTKFTIDGKDQLVNSNSSVITTSCSTTIYSKEITECIKWVWDFKKDGKWNYESAIYYSGIDKQISDITCNVIYDSHCKTKSDSGIWKLCDNKTLSLHYSNGDSVSFEIKTFNSKYINIIGNVKNSIHEYEFKKY